MSVLAAIKRFWTNCKGIWRIVRRYPSTLLWPLFVLGLVLGFGIWGVLRIAEVEESSAKSRAASLALDTAVWFVQQISVATAPVQLMSAMVKYNPEYDAVRSLFNALAPALLEQAPPGTIRQLEYIPNGRISDIYPRQIGNVSAINKDLFESDSRDGAIKTVADRTMTLVGPLTFFEGGHGVIVRNPIFIGNVSANTDFDIPWSISPACGGACDYDAVNCTKFWGFAAGLIDLDMLTGANNSKLRVLEDLGYRYEVLALGLAESNFDKVVASKQPVSHPVEAPIHLPNTQWVVRVSPEGGWRSANVAGFLAAAVLVAVALALLLFAALVSRKRNQMLLEALLPSHVIDDLRGADASRVLRPRILQAETTADLMLNMLARLLEGHMPDLRDVVFIRQAIIRGVDLYQPLDLKQHIRNANLDNEVARALMQQLGNNTLAASIYDGSARRYLSSDFPSMLVGGGEHAFAVQGKVALQVGQHHTQSQQQLQEGPLRDCSTLTGALALILTPQPAAWRDTLDPLEEFPMDGEPSLVRRETDASSVASPRPSTYSGMLRAMSLFRDGATGAAGGGSGGGVTSAAAGGTSVQLLPPAVSHGAVHRSPGGTGGLALSHEREEQLQQQQRQPLSAQLQLQRQQQQQQIPEQHLQTPGKPRRTSLIFRDSSLSHSREGLSVGVNGPAGGCGGGGTEVALPSAPPPTPPSELVNGCGDSDGTPASASTTLDDGHLATGTFSVVRRLPRRVSSAINVLGRPRAIQRNSSLILAANGANNHVDLVIERRHAAAMSAAAAVITASSLPRRASVASVASVPEGAVGCGGQCDPGPNGAGLVLGSGYGTAAISRRSQLGGHSRAATAHRVMSMPPPPPVIEEVERLLAGACSWKFDTWRLHEVTQGHPLSSLGFYLMHRAGLISRFGIKPDKLARLLRHIEGGYNDNPYHNATHAADVLQTLHVIIHGAQLHVHYLDPLGLLAAYFAAIVHDYGHPGLTNDFLVATSDPLAVRYNDRSPLENHHAAASFGLMQKPGMDALAPLSKAEKTAFRKQVIEMVLATDMKQHFALLSQFNTAHRLLGFVHEASSSDASTTGRTCTATSRPPAAGRTNSDLSEVVVDIESAATLEHTAPKPLDDTERLLTLQLAIKSADLGHLGEELEVHQRWLSNLEEEFFRQGDRERQQGMPISPLFDRSKQGVSKSQVGFYDFVALPLVHSLCAAFAGARPLMRCFLSNYNHWRSVDGQAPVPMPARKDATTPPTTPAATSPSAAVATASVQPNDAAA